MLHRILMRLGVAWLVLVAIGTAIALPLNSDRPAIALMVGAVCCLPALLIFALAWVFKPAS